MHSLCLDLAIPSFSDMIFYNKIEPLLTSVNIATVKFLGGAMFLNLPVLPLKCLKTQVIDCHCEAVIPATVC